jgi:fucokinase
VSPDRGGAWDYLIVTASNDRQAEAYRAEIGLRARQGRIPQAKRVLVVADPGGLRVGSGGSTIACLMRVLEIELGGSADRFADPRAWRETLDRLRILIIHAGGDSKRLPAYGPCGKIFVPVPAGLRPGPPASARAWRLPVTIFDRLAPIYLGLPAPANGRGHTVVTTGDVLLFFDPRRAAFTRGGITALGCLVSPETSKNHGVFIPDEESTIRRYLQKPSVAAQVEAGAVFARGRSILDLGVMSFDAETAARMLDLAGVRSARESGRHRLAWSGPTARALETWGLDIFREIACALGADTDFAGYVEAARAAGSPWDEARLRRVYTCLHGLDFSLSLLPRCRFLHFGTSRELIRSGNALRRRDRTAAAGDSVVSLNTTFRGRGRGGRIAGKESWVEGCDIGAKLTLAGRNVVVGLDVDEPLALPRGAALDVLKGADRKGRAVWFVRAYAVDDVFHKPAEKGVRNDRGGRLAGLPLGEWLEAMGARPEDVWGADVPPGGRQVWNGRFFPAAARASGYRDWLWLLEPRKATAAQKRAWRAADRYSFAEMAALADQEAFHARRRG